MMIRMEKFKDVKASGSMSELGPKVDAIDLRFLEFYRRMRFLDWELLHCHDPHGLERLSLDDLSRNLG